MRVVFKKSFLKEVKKIRNKHLKDLIEECILQVEGAANLSAIKNLKKLTGYDIYYRVRVGDYRVGLKIENDLVFFVTIEHRKDIYRKFP